MQRGNKTRESECEVFCRRHVDVSWCVDVVTVKGVNFYGPRSEYVVSGSDCGNVFLWDKNTANVVNYFHADDGGVVSSTLQCLLLAYTRSPPVDDIWAMMVSGGEISKLFCVVLCTADVNGHKHLYKQFI